MGRRFLHEKDPLLKNIESFCINLERRTDRWVQAQKEFNKMGIKAQRVSAVEGCRPEGDLTGAQVSCKNSHKKVWRLVIDLKIDMAAIFEDDIIFSDDLHEVLDMSIRELPNDWELLNLHSTHAATKPLGIYTNLIIEGLWGAHGYIIKRQGAERLLYTNNHSDYSLAEGFIEKGGVPYGIREEWTVCSQRGDDSDIPETQQIDFWRKFSEEKLRRKK